MAQDPTPSTPPTSMLGVADRVAKLLGIAAAGLLVLSASYDFSFLYALGLSFDEVPSTLADHARSAIVWAPSATIYILAFAMYEMFMRRLEKGLSEEELIQRSPNPKFTRAFRRSPQIMFAVSAVLIIVTNTLFTASSFGLYLAGIFIWGTLSVGVVTHPRMGARFSATGGRLFVIVPLVVIWVGLLGYVRGERMLTSKVTHWIIEVTVGQTTEKRQLIGLRRFSTSTIVVTPERQVSILPSERIVVAQLIQNEYAEAPRICRWFGVSCSASKKSPP